MRMIVLSALVALSSTAVWAGDYVRGHTRSNGTYVEPYYKSSPNNSTFDNYSTKGNVNPYTGQAGTVDPSYRAPSNYGYSSNYLGSRR
jgi:hypothetical protein